MADDVVTPVVEATEFASPAAATSAPKTFSEHYAAAKAEQSAKDQAAAEAAPPAEGAESAEQPQAGDQTEVAAATEDTLLTADEVATLSPKEKTLYEKAQKNYTQKTQALAAQKRELEPWQNLVSALSDPLRSRDTVQELAVKAGLLSAEPAQAQTVTKEASQIVSNLPEGFEFLQPILEQFGKNLLSTISAKVDPIASTQTELLTKSIADSTEATIKSFGESHKGWEKHEGKMLEIAKTFLPAQGMTDFAYMENLYKLATYDLRSADQTKQVVAKLVKSAAAAETPVAGVQAERVEHTRPANFATLSSSDRLKASYEAAKRGERWA